MDNATLMTILTVFGLFGYLWWWGRQPNQYLDKVLDKVLDDGYPPDTSKPILTPPVYKGFREKKQESLPKEEDAVEFEPDPVVAARPTVLEPPPRPTAHLHLGSRKDNERKPFMADTRDDAPVKPVVQLLSKYGHNALSDPMSIEDLREFVHRMVGAGYELKKVWPNKGTHHIAYLIFKE